MTRVVGIGQSLAGDDGVGVAVATRVRELAPDLEVIAPTDPTRLVDLLETRERVVIVDAVMSAEDPGRVLCLRPEQFAERGLGGVSSHGIGVAEAVDLARALLGATASPDVRIVGVAIGAPRKGTVGLSAPVAGAVERAARAVLAIVEET